MHTTTDNLDDDSLIEEFKYLKCLEITGRFPIKIETQISKVFACSSLELFYVIEISK